MDKHFMRYKDAAAFLMISEMTLRRKVMNREVPHLKPFGRMGRVLFSEADLLAFLERSRVPATEPATTPGRRAKASAGSAA